VAGAGGLVAVDAATGAARWRAAVGPAAGPPVVFGQRVYVATRDRLVAVDRGSGTEDLDQRQAAAGVRSGGRLGAGGGRGQGTGTLLGFAP
jgi:outer membrane protein assembly factor BamB